MEVTKTYKSESSKRNLTIRYIFSLCAIALLTILSYILMQVNIRNQSDDSRVINIAGRQRMLSQELSKSVLYLEKSESTNNREMLIDEIKRILSEWEKAHNGLKFGNVALGVPGENSSKVKEMFSEIEPIFNTILNAAQSLLAINENQLSENLLVSPDSLVKRILMNEQNFLHGMESIVFQYDKEAKEKVERHENIEDLFMFLILSVLLIEGFFIFKPAVQRMQFTLNELSQTEQELRNSRDSLRALASRLQEVREEERAEIARDIHDDLGQSLTTLKIYISILAESTKDKDLISKTVSMSALVDSTLKTIQRVVARLRPGILDDWGLIAAMEWQLEEFQSSTEIKYKFKYDDIDMTNDVERSTTLFRIFQELLTNIIRHANASAVKVHLGVNDDILTLELSDNGIGISEKDKKDSKSYGIMGISERLIPWNGKFEIRSKKDEGTKATVILPLSIENFK